MTACRPCRSKKDHVPAIQEPKNADCPNRRKRKRKRQIEHKITACAEGDDEFIADKLNAITESKIKYEDAVENELAVFKVTDSSGNIIAGCNLAIDRWRAADLDILWVEENTADRGSAQP